jgi:hypothetical protein
MPDPTLENELFKRSAQEPTTSRESLGMLLSGLSESAQPTTVMAKLLKAIGADPLRGPTGSIPLNLGGWQGEASASLPWAEQPEATVSLEHEIPKGSVQVEGGHDPYAGWKARMAGRIGWGK